MTLPFFPPDFFYNAAHTNSLTHPMLPRFRVGTLPVEWRVVEDAAIYKYPR